MPATRQSDTYATLSLRIDKLVIRQVKAVAAIRGVHVEALVESILTAWLKKEK